MRCGLTATSITKINIIVYVPFVSIEDVGGRVFRHAPRKKDLRLMIIFNAKVIYNILF